MKTVILAAGQGTRMNSNIPKVLHKINNKHLIDYSIEIGNKIGSSEIVVVVGHKHNVIKEALKEKNVKFVIQEEQLGTGHAVMMAEKYINDDDVLVLFGDCPLIPAETIEHFIKYHRESNNDLSCISSFTKEPKGYGRIVRGNNAFLKNVEEKDATEEERKIEEVNVGVYLFKSGIANLALSKLGNNNAQNEYYITDTLEIVKQNGKVGVYTDINFNNFMGINTKSQLAIARKIMQDRINENLMDSGAIIIDPATAYIDATVKIGIDTVIEPNVIIKGDTEIGLNCTIGANTKITNCKIGDNVEINSSVAIDSKIGNGTKVGPFAYIRPNSNLGENVKIGDFVEVKNSNIGKNSKASHLTYIGDSDLGENINVGCGTITVNYDGKNKARTVIGDNSFIGCNSNLVAPVEVEKNSYVACGTTVVKNVPEKSLAIGRVRQENKKNWIRD
ncbi:MAG: bifunctional UDP-N-acetylglucosamine diphosphorylase/glucosamine-1-phosphate N-acetyltransferase GlmU [Lachnospirales bacterium]